MHNFTADWVISLRESRLVTTNVRLSCTFQWFIESSLRYESNYFLLKFENSLRPQIISFCTEYVYSEDDWRNGVGMWPRFLCEHRCWRAASSRLSGHAARHDIPCYFRLPRTKNNIDVYRTCVCMSVNYNYWRGCYKSVLYEATVNSDSRSYLLSFQSNYNEEFGKQCNELM